MIECGDVLTKTGISTIKRRAPEAGRGVGPELHASSPAGYPSAPGRRCALVPPPDPYLKACGTTGPTGGAPVLRVLHVR